MKIKILVESKNIKIRRKTVKPAKIIKPPELISKYYRQRTKSELKNWKIYQT